MTTTAADTLNRLLTACITQDGSDLHLSPGLAPRIRIHGQLVPLPGEPVYPAATIEGVALEILRCAGVENPTAPMPRGSVDGALTSPSGARFRFNVFRRQGELALALRRLEDRFRSLAELGLPESLSQLCNLRDGLVIVSGPTGAGKSTTLATLLDHVNRTRQGHIITIEDPIEYLHKSIRCVVNQRQVGLDAPSFNDALVASLRQDPDVVLVGEIRDLDTIRTAITAAETGHLVFTTLHAGDCVGSIERLVSVFPSGEQEGIRRQLSIVLRGIIAQHLLPTQAPPSANGQNIPNQAEAGPLQRVVASEILMVTTAVANLIATGRSSQIYSTMEAGASQGTQTLEQDLARLCFAGRISDTTAEAMAKHVNVLRDRVNSLRRRAALVTNGNGNGGGRE